ncbi:hypothetical protein N657DRAFT_634120 [Parathielavia appendiculata]|uniref:Uncharacterized protein n=1 Tax=Parathielavia appendiculata TaxID=2587402 RepID=A0AAN6Z3T1_9PEZI|nr:hypothetical protein N657DRAFT_634120 [Parathielavia appendiculata]
MSEIDSRELHASIIYDAGDNKTDRIRHTECVECSMQMGEVLDQSLGETSVNKPDGTFERSRASSAENDQGMTSPADESDTFSRGQGIGPLGRSPDPAPRGRVGAYGGVSHMPNSDHTPEATTGEGDMKTKSRWHPAEADPGCQAEGVPGRGQTRAIISGSTGIGQSRSEIVVHTIMLAFNNRICVVAVVLSSR